jgi:hypothetical protein
VCVSSASITHGPFTKCGRRGLTKGCLPSFIFGLGSVVSNLCLTNSVHVYRRYRTEERYRRRGCRLSLAVTAVQSSMTAALADLKYVQNLSVLSVNNVNLHSVGVPGKQGMYSQSLDIHVLGLLGV